jgi:hypothetical protein
MNITRTTNTLTIELKGADLAGMESIVYHFIDANFFGVDVLASTIAEDIAEALESGTR